MLPKINRLTKKSDFDLVFKKGKSTKSDFLIFKELKNHLKIARFGFVVSKKVSNKATVRNAVKRKLRAAVAKQLNGFKKPADIIMIALSGIVKKEFLEIQKTVADYLKK